MVASCLQETPGIEGLSHLFVAGTSCHMNLNVQTLRKPCPETARFSKSLLQRFVRFPSLSCFQVSCQVSVVVLMRADHDQLQCVGARHAVRQEILRGVDLELVDEYAAQLTSLLLSDGWILGDSPDLLVQNLLLLFAEALDPRLK